MHLHCMSLLLYFFFSSSFFNLLYFKCFRLFLLLSETDFSACLNLFRSFFLDATSNVFPGTSFRTLQSKTLKDAPIVNWQIASAIAVCIVLLPTYVAFGQIFHTRWCRDSFAFWVMFLEHLCSNCSSDSL